MKIILDVLKQIYGIGVIRDGISFSPDGNPYNLMQQIMNEEKGLPADKRKYDWFVPTSGSLHQSMNMLKTLVGTYYEFNIEGFLKPLKGYNTYNKEVILNNISADFHRSKQMFLSLFFYSKVGAIISDFKNECYDKSLYAFKAWRKGKEVSDPSYKLLFEQIFVYFTAAKMYNDAIRQNNLTMKRAAQAIFEPIWYIQRHPIYIKIQLLERIDAKLVRDDILSMNNSLHGYARHEGVNFKYQGLDAILEEIHKEIVLHVPANSTNQQYENAFANYAHLRKIRDAFDSSIQGAPSNNAEKVIHRPYPIADIIFHRIYASLNDEAIYNCLASDKISEEFIESDITKLGYLRRNEYINVLNKSKNRCETVSFPIMYISENLKQAVYKRKTETPALKKEIEVLFKMLAALVAQQRAKLIKFISYSIRLT